jgi:hypothetical protein
MKTNPHGSGFMLPQGFSRRAETGYAIPESRCGCNTAWPGYFYDPFNYTAQSSGTQTAFGSSWNVIYDFGHTYQLNASPGSVKATAQSGDFWIYPGCSAFPTLATEQKASILWDGSDYAVNTDGGGPVVFLTQIDATTGHGYVAQVMNTQTFDGSLATTTARLFLLKSPGSTLGSAVVTDTNPPNNNGPFQYTHTIGIKGTFSGGTLTLRVFFDDPTFTNGNEKILATDNSPFPSTGKPGIFFGGHMQCTKFFCTGS